VRLPVDHALRRELNEEMHARPAEALRGPARISYLALLTDLEERERFADAVADLGRRRMVAPPPPGSNHFSADLGPYRLIWERHTEFCRLTVIAPGAGENPFAEPALALLPDGWVDTLPGQLVVAAHAGLMPPAPAGRPDFDRLSARLFGGNVLTGSSIVGGAATALTDFRVHGDGFSRFWIQDHSMTPWQAGRAVQRLLEMDTYRILALLALPEARRLSAILIGMEQKLTEVATALVSATEADEPHLLDRLTDLAAEVESRDAETRYRFSASNAYWGLVQRRIAELREIRIEGLQTLQEFTERRVGPGMETCRAVATRQAALAQRVARATQLLSTRVDVTREQQNQAMLNSLNERAAMQVRLQRTVEGLSLAAITYYIVGLIGYVAKGLDSARVLRVDPDLITGIAIPIVAGIGWLGLQRVRRRLERGED
jgi:uncharacterized membrane-anchored protein